MGQVQDKMCEDMRLRGLAENTQEAYQRAARGFVAFHMRPAEELGTQEVRQYLLFLLDVARRNPTTVNLVISALRFLYGTTLGRPEVMQPVHSVIKHQPLPILLSGSEMERLIEHAPAPIYRAIFTLLYGAGLRVSEALHLEVGDVDSQRMVITVRRPKNRHARQVPMPVLLLAARRVASSR